MNKNKDTHNNIHIIMNTKAKLINTLHNLERKIDNINSILRKTDEILWKTCEHEWERDHDSLYDPIKYRCIHCNLWNHPTRYLLS